MSFLCPNHHQLKGKPMSRMKTFKTVTGNKLGETGKAVRFQILEVSGVPLEHPRTEWFPFSQIDKMFTDPNEVGKDYLIVSEWILQEKGIV